LCIKALQSWGTSIVPEDPNPVQIDRSRVWGGWGYSDRLLGFHLYGADLCLQAAERGLAVVALGALCYHNSRSVGLPEAFFPSAEVLARKWRHRLPVATPCVVIDRQGPVRLLANADEDSIAYAEGSFGHGLNTDQTDAGGRLNRRKRRERREGREPKHNTCK
jgi:hypothetical protein